jgi:hypothetical protein
MNYLVSAENTPYYHWQIELLIESFKYHSCEKELLVCLSGEKAQGHPMYTRNILNHENIKIKENIGEKRGLPKLNILYDLYWSTERNWINQPFIQIPASSALYQPPQLEFSGKYPEIIYSPTSFFTFEEAEENINNFWEIAGKPKDYYQKYWIPLGNFIAFNQIPKELFLKSIITAEKLALNQILNNQKIWKKTAKLALACTISEQKDFIYLSRKENLSVNMLDFKKAPFIDYQHGMPPIFNKKLFQFKPPEFFSFGEPLSILKENPSTPTAQFLSNLAKNLLDQFSLVQK